MRTEIRIDGANVMIPEENKEWGNSAAPMLGGSPFSRHIYVEDADATVAQAVEARATFAHPMADMFWRDRMGSVTSPFGFMRSA
ncbi:MAG: VOC family protein, partial [Pseudomonadota bacterium]|nr:VOC family protein [Pseudomonadota bacterium]